MVSFLPAPRKYLTEKEAPFDTAGLKVGGHAKHRYAKDAYRILGFDATGWLYCACPPERGNIRPGVFAAPRNQFTAMEVRV